VLICNELIPSPTTSLNPPTIAWENPQKWLWRLTACWWHCHADVPQEANHRGDKHWRFYNDHYHRRHHSPGCCVSRVLIPGGLTQHYRGLAPQPVAAGKARKWRGKRPRPEHRDPRDRWVITPQCHSHVDN
jgi:hypothetical protein